MIRQLRARLGHSAPKTRYAHLLEVVSGRNPRRLLEIGVWRGDRAEGFLKHTKALIDYVGADLFEEIDAETYAKESMGSCRPTRMAEVQQRLEEARVHPSTSIRLIKGPTQSTLPMLASERPASFDLIYLDGGHSLDTVANDWACSLKLVCQQGTIIFDDYYVNDASRGAKPLVDGLLEDRRFRVRFFPMIEDIVEDLQITMVAVTVLGGAAVSSSPRSPAS
jgi:hypothetical protein